MYLDGRLVFFLEAEVCIIKIDPAVGFEPRSDMLGCRLGRTPL